MDHLVLSAKVQFSKKRREADPVIFASDASPKKDHPPPDQALAGDKRFEETRDQGVESEMVLRGSLRSGNLTDHPGT